MTLNRKWLVGGIALAVIGAAAAGAVARHGGHGWGHHGGGWKHGWHGRKGPMRMVCGRRSAERIDHMLVRIKHKADITDAQQPAFDEFADTVRTAAAKARESCPPKPDWKKRRAERAEGGEQADATPRLKPSPIERLANMEKMLAAGLEAIRTVRPSAEKLYATLSEEQQNKLRKMRRGRGWGKHRRWRRDHQRDRDRPRSERSDSDSDSDSNDDDADGSR